MLCGYESKWLTSDRRLRVGAISPMGAFKTAMHESGACHKLQVDHAA
jgi:hypothetical protein